METNQNSHTQEQMKLTEKGKRYLDVFPTQESLNKSIQSFVKELGKEDFTIDELLEFAEKQKALTD